MTTKLDNGDTAPGPTRTAISTSDPPPMFAIYIHWPFCRSKCLYCDFNSHVRDSIEQARWRAALLRELDHFAVETADRTVTSVFFGGGTPSLMAPRTVAAVLDRVAANWRLSDDLEITLEANPTSSESAAFQAYRLAGVNRLSLGVQAFDDDALRMLGRGHDRQQALAALALARRIFPRYTFDLIYARPGQSVASWRTELAQGIAEAGGHISVYQLTIEPGTAFNTLYVRGDLVMPDQDHQAALYETTQEVLAEAGLPGYEISNHARPNEACRHNLAYWRCCDYLGVGPGAHGRLTLYESEAGGGRYATTMHRAPEVWLDRVETFGHGERRRTRLDEAATATEVMLMGLRLVEGVEMGRVDAVLDRDALDRLSQAGMVRCDGDRLVATSAGRQRLDAVLASLVAD